MDASSPLRTMFRRQSRATNNKPVKVDKILTNNGSVPAEPSLPNHVASPTSPTFSTSSATRPSFESHSRSMSAATEAAMTSPRASRLSVSSFPLHTSTASPVRALQSPIAETSFAFPEASASPTGPADTSFLTAIAAQERKVLELKEEVQRAEADLNALKRQWAEHEAHKKRDDARRVTKLQPLPITTPDLSSGESSDAAGAGIQHGRERRRTMVNGGKTGSGRVFSSSKHTRTLSLLASSATHNKPPPAQRTLPPRKDSLPGGTARGPDEHSRAVRPSLISRTSTAPDLTTQVIKTADTNIDLKEQGLDHELLIRTGRKMATDFKDGLWTFLEDLRQATVGDEPRQGQPRPPRRQSTIQSVSSQRSQTGGRPSSRASGTGRASKDLTRSSPTRRPHNLPTAREAMRTPSPELADPFILTDQTVVEAPATPATVKKSHAHKASPRSPTTDRRTSHDDVWDTWPSSPPNPSRASDSSSAGSEPATLPSTVSGPTSPRRSADSPASTRADSNVTTPMKKDPIPWPTLSKMSPATLRRTASHLLSEWERSPLPSPTREILGKEDYLGLGSSPAGPVAVER